MLCNVIHLCSTNSCHRACTCTSLYVYTIHATIHCRTKYGNRVQRTLCHSNCTRVRASMVAYNYISAHTRGEHVCDSEHPTYMYMYLCSSAESLAVHVVWRYRTMAVKYVSAVLVRRGCKEVFHLWTMPGQKNPPARSFRRKTCCSVLLRVQCVPPAEETGRSWWCVSGDCWRSSIMVG